MVVRVAQVVLPVLDGELALDLNKSLNHVLFFEIIDAPASWGVGGGMCERRSAIVCTFLTLICVEYPGSRYTHKAS